MNLTEIKILDGAKGKTNLFLPSEIENATKILTTFENVPINDLYTYQTENEDFLLASSLVEARLLYQLKYTLALLMFYGR